MKWNYTAGSETNSSPAVADGVAYVGPEDHKLYALADKTGALLSSYTTGNFVESSPAVANGMVCVGSGGTLMYALNASTGARLWNCATGELFSSPAVSKGKPYVTLTDANLYVFGRK